MACDMNFSGLRFMIIVLYQSFFFAFEIILPSENVTFCEHDFGLNCTQVKCLICFLRFERVDSVP